MDYISQYQVTDAYLIASASMVCVCLYIFLKFRQSWSRETWLVYSIGGWIMSELIALILFSLEYSQQVKLPQVLSSSIHIILTTISLWGVAILQIIAIIYTFTIIINKEEWWKWLLVLECIEVLLTVILRMIPNIPAPFELACITPFTSQVAAIGVLFLASQGMSSEKRIAYHFLFLGLLIIMASAVVLGVSLSGLYTRLMFPQWLLYMAPLVVSYRLPESPRRASRTGGDSELELAATHGLRDDLRSPHVNGQERISSGASPPRAQTASSLATTTSSNFASTQ